MRCIVRVISTQGIHITVRKGTLSFNVRVIDNVDVLRETVAISSVRSKNSC